MERTLATGVDILILGFYVMTIGTVIPSTTILFYVLITPVLMMYHFLFEVYNDGQTIGKRLMNIKVVSLHGRKPAIADLFLRWIFRMIDVTFSVGIIGLVSMLSTIKSQRIGDIIANTTVINLKGGNQVIDLKSIENISDAEHEVAFPSITMYNDTDMLLVKDVIKRMNRNPNVVNRDIAQKLALKIKNDLGLSNVGMTSVKFLEQVLIDYIILTR